MKTSARAALPALLATFVVACSLIVKPDPATQCTTSAECTGLLDHRVCREGFCVLPESQDGSGADDGSTGTLDAGAGTDADPGTDAGPGDLLAPREGDMVVLLPDGIDADADTTVNAWNNAVPGATLRQAVAEDLPSVGKPKVRERGGRNCVEMALYQRMLLTDDADGGFTTPGPLSVTAVVLSADEAARNDNHGGAIPVARFDVTSSDSSFDALGWGLRTAWQAGDGEPVANRFGASIEAVGGSASAQFAHEAIDPNPHDTQLHVLALAVRDDPGGGQQVQLWVDGATRGAASFVKSQPRIADLTLGSILDPPYQWAAFEGDLCAVIVHHGTEADEAFLARQQALKTYFAIP